jgi:hypothetical protein
MIEASGLASKALTAAGKVGPFLAVYNAWIGPLNGTSMSEKFSSLVQNLKNFKIANPIITTELALANPDKYPIGEAVGLAGIGYGIKLVGDGVGNSTVERMGGIVMKYGAAAFTNLLVSSYVYEAQNNPHSGGASGGSVPGRTPAVQSTIIRDNPQGMQHYFPGGNAYYAV